MSSTGLFLSIIFSSIGLGYFIYGKRQGQGIQLVVGLALMACPYFISNLILLVLISLALIAVPAFVR